MIQLSKALRVLVDVLSFKIKTLKTIKVRAILSDTPTVDRRNRDVILTSPSLRLVILSETLRHRICRFTHSVHSKHF